MRCVASAISCRRRSTSCCQHSAISDELHKLLCGMCPLSSFDIFFPFSSCQCSAIGLCGVKCPFPVKSEEGKPRPSTNRIWSAITSGPENESYRMDILLIWEDSDGRLPRYGDAFPSLFRQLPLPAKRRSSH